MPRLPDLPAGTTLFLDANIFLEHLLGGHPACTTLFQRLDSGEVRGITSVAILAEVRHRLLLTELVRRGHISRPHRALDALRQRPELLDRLSGCDDGLDALLDRIRVVGVTPAQFRSAQRLSLRYRLLTNDALHVATMRAHRLRHLASADRDFLRVRPLTVWTP